VFRFAIGEAILKCALCHATHHTYRTHGISITREKKDLRERWNRRHSYTKKWYGERFEYPDQVKDLKKSLHQRDVALVEAREALESLRYSAGSILFERAKGDKALATIGATTK
jgi:hypothetical protein